MFRLYNTLTRKKEDFIPLNKDEVSIYSCGPTVYSIAHIGNMRAYIFVDSLRKTLKYNGYNIKQVMNITDVGHLTSDADEGEDKMELESKKLSKDPAQIAKEVTNVFFEDCKKLNIERAEYITPATEHIKEMEEYVAKIVENGFGYETSKGIYFDTSKLKTYGELSHKNIDKQLAGARIEVDKEKKNPLDFALWIKAPKEHIMKWNSRWGECYPGWHIECSSMSNKYLGQKFDIHTGGVDHIDIHHENEIAQSRGAYDINPATYWMHNEFILIDSGKMGKSLHNDYKLKDLEDKGFEPLAFRYLTYTSSYRNKLNFTWEALNSAKISLINLRSAYFEHLNAEETNIDIDTKIQELKDRFDLAINDDLNFPLALSVVWEIAKSKTKSKQMASLLKEFDRVLSLDIDKIDEKKEVTDTEKENNNVLSKEIKDILQKRQDARKNKDFTLSDNLRDKALKLGYKIIDGKDTQTLEKL